MSKAAWMNKTNTLVSEGVKLGLVQHVAEAGIFNGRTVSIHGQSLINFSLCSYLGLELDPQIKLGIIEAVTKYGSQFSSSRAYISAPLYSELEEALTKIFGGHILVTPTTTLGHIASLPVLINENDVVIIDQQVHNSVQTAVMLLQAQGIIVERVKHNCMESLENKIIELVPKYKNIWYLTDGVFSMHGDLAPIDALQKLLIQYEQLNLYLDDAHGMSWTGQNGRGFVLSKLPLQERVVIATSLVKAFSGGGGVLIFANSELRDKVRNCGGPMIFSGPVQPPMLGASLASAKIHLSSGFQEKQEELMHRILYCNQLLKDSNLPVGSLDTSPIRFINIGSNESTALMFQTLFQEGFYANFAAFPAVPLRKAGIRFTLTTHLKIEDIKRFVEAISINYDRVMSSKAPREEVYAARLCC